MAIDSLSSTDIVLGLNANEFNAELDKALNRLDNFEKAVERLQRKGKILEAPTFSRPNSGTENIQFISGMAKRPYTSHMPKYFPSNGKSFLVNIAEAQNTIEQQFERELSLIRDKGKRSKLVTALASTGFTESFFRSPAARRRHEIPQFMQRADEPVQIMTAKGISLGPTDAGSLSLHTKAVTQAAVQLGISKGLTQESIDDLVVNAISHEFMKVDPQGRGNKTYATDIGEELKAAGLKDYTSTHMSAKGKTEEEQILHEADMLISRRYSGKGIEGKTDIYGKPIDITSVNVAAIRKEATARGDLVDGEWSEDIANEQEKIAKSSKKSEISWLSVLSSAGRFVNLVKAVAGSVLKIDTLAGQTIDKNYGYSTAGAPGFTGLTPLEQFRNRTMSMRLGLDPNAMSNSSSAHAQRKGLFLTKGVFDKALDASLSGVLQEAYIDKDLSPESYFKTLDKAADRLRGMAPAERTKQMGLLAGVIDQEGMTALNHMLMTGQTTQQLRSNEYEGYGNFTGSRRSALIDMKSELEEIRAMQDAAASEIALIWEQTLGLGLRRGLMNLALTVQDIVSGVPIGEAISKAMQRGKVEDIKNTNELLENATINPINGMLSYKYNHKLPSEISKENYLNSSEEGYAKYREAKRYEEAYHRREEQREEIKKAYTSTMYDVSKSGAVQPDNVYKAINTVSGFLKSTSTIEHMDSQQLIHFQAVLDSFINAMKYNGVNEEEQEAIEGHIKAFAPDKVSMTLEIIDNRTARASISSQDNWLSIGSVSMAGAVG